MAEDVTIVWFVVMVHIHRHDCIRSIIRRRISILMHIPNENHSIVINGLAACGDIHSFTCIVNSGIDLLLITITIEVYIRIITVLSAEKSNILFNIVFIKHHIVILVADVCSSTPVGFNGNSRHAIRHVEIGSLREYPVTATSSIKIFVGAVAVGKVETSPRVRLRVCTLTSSCHAGNLPTSHHPITSIVSCTNIVVVR